MSLANQIKELREATNAGFLDCKKALEESNNNFEKAVEWLRKKGIANAAKKSDRVTNDGLVAIELGQRSAGIIEINSETDFVARNELFQNLVKKIVHAVLTNKLDNIEKLNKCTIESGEIIEEAIVQGIATIGEKITLNRACFLEVNEGVIASYVHNSIAPSLGRIGVLVAIESSGPKDQLEEFGKKLALHVAAAAPLTLTTQEVDPQIIQKEREIFIEQSKSSGKPEDVINKMVEGRIRKFYEEHVLLEQIFVIDGKTKISALIQDFEKTLGTSIKIKKFIRFEVGK